MLHRYNYTANQKTLIMTRYTRFLFFPLWFCPELIKVGKYLIILSKFTFFFHLVSIRVHNILSRGTKVYLANFLKLLVNLVVVNCVSLPLIQTHVCFSSLSHRQLIWTEVQLTSPRGRYVSLANPYNQFHDFLLKEDDMITKCTPTITFFFTYLNTIKTKIYLAYYT